MGSNPIRHPVNFLKFIYSLPTNDKITLVFSFLAFLVSIIGIIIAVKSWHRSRVYYDIETNFYRADALEGLRKKLSTGKYTVISSYKDEFNNTVILLGKIKK
jgi:hypothetical protein